MLVELTGYLGALYVNPAQVTHVEPLGTAQATIYLAGREAGVVANLPVGEVAELLGLDSREARG